MSIASEITRINTNIENAYTACNGKGATMPATQNSANLATCITSIPAGSTAGQTRVVENGVYKIPTSNFTFTLPNDATDIGDNALKNTFEGLSGVIGADFSSLITLSGDSALNQAFSSCTNLTNITFPSLTTISGDSALNQAFTDTNLTNITFPSLTTISSYGALYVCFLGCSSLTSVDLSNLTTISGERALDNTFYDCSSLTSVDLSSLTTISGDNALYLAFSECPSLTNIEFTSLTNLTGSRAFIGAFSGSSSLTTLSFPALTSTSFGSYTDQFETMLDSVSGCTVHFPINLQWVIGSWSDVINGFGGTNTTVLFDLPATE